MEITRLQPTAGFAILFKLPRELRDKVYHELWKDGALIKQRYGRVKYNITYGELRYLPSKSCKHPWLLTNKQMLHEGIQQLHTESIWHMFDYHQRKTKRVNYVLPLMTPGRAQHVRIHLNHLRSNMDMNIKTLHRIVTKLLSDPHASSLRSIRVTTYCNGGPFGASDKPFSCDFSALERLQALQNLEQLLFVVEGERHRGAPHWQHRLFEHNARHPAYEKFRGGLRQLARLLIPEYKYEEERRNNIHGMYYSPSDGNVVYATSSFEFKTRSNSAPGGARVQ